MLYGYIVNDIRIANIKSRQEQLNSTLQNFIYTLIQDSEHAVAARKSLDVLIDLYRKQVWRDVKTVNMIAETCLSPITKMRVAAINFFLHPGAQEKEEVSDNEEEGSRNLLKQLQMRAKVAKKTRSRESRVKRAIQSVHKKEKEKDRPHDVNFHAIELINDPQGSFLLEHGLFLSVESVMVVIINVFSYGSWSCFL